jgi:hypothetical protein
VRRCPICDATLSRFNYGRFCALHEGITPPTEDEAQQEKDNRMAQIAALHTMGWTWSELGFLVEMNPDYLCNEVHKWERGEE